MIKQCSFCGKAHRDLILGISNKYICKICINQFHKVMKAGKHLLPAQYKLIKGHKNEPTDAA